MSTILDGFVLEEPGQGKKSEKTPYVYVRTSGVITINAGAQEKYGFKAGSIVAIYTRNIDNAEAKAILVKDAENGHKTKGVTEKSQCQVSDAILAGKLIMAVRRVKGEEHKNITTIKKVDIPITQVNDQSGKYYTLELSAASIVYDE